MKFSNLFLLSVLIIATGYSIQAQEKHLKGEGEAITQDRNGGIFNEIRSFGSFNINITDANDHTVKVEAQQNLQEYIEIENKGNELHIRNKKGYSLETDKPITIHVSAPALRAIHLSGSGNVTSTNTLNGSNEFDLKSSGSGNISIDIETFSLGCSIAGSGNITLKGKTNELDGKIAGSGNIRAKELQSAITSVKISGSGSAEVVATQKLETKIAGSGDVKYWGDASVDSKVMGSGSIQKQK